MNNTDNNESKFKYPIHSVEHAFSLLEVLADNTKSPKPQIPAYY